MNILVTGANGQLGSEIGNIAPLSANNYIFTDVKQLDITNADAILSMLKEHSIDVVINCAAYTNVDKAQTDAKTADDINHRAVGYLAEGCCKCDATLIHISTDYVFDGSHNTPYTEDMATAPLGVYGKTKLDGERSVIESGCKYLIFRTSWLYSRFGNNFVKTMQRLTSERDTLSVVFDQVGTPTSAADLAALICRVIEEGKIASEGLYHFSNEGVCSWYDFAVEIARLSGNKCDINPCHSDEFESIVKRPHFSVLDKSKVKRAFGVSIPHWRDSLMTYINCDNR